MSPEDLNKKFEQALKDHPEKVVEAILEPIRRALKKPHLPLCVTSLHPFLGRPGWKKTCPLCGWKAE